MFQLPTGFRPSEGRTPEYLVACEGLSSCGGSPGVVELTIFGSGIGENADGGVYATTPVATLVKLGGVAFRSNPEDLHTYTATGGLASQGPRRLFAGGNTPPRTGAISADADAHESLPRAGNPVQPQTDAQKSRSASRAYPQDSIRPRAPITIGLQRPWR